MKILPVLSTSLIALSSCATHEQISTEHHGHTTIIHHKHHSGNGVTDRIEAINPKGIVTQAVVKVYDVGRLPDGQGGMHEAHEYYRVSESAHLNTNLPVRRGPVTVYTPPNYSPVPKDQRVNDAVTEANDAKKKLEDARTDVEKRLAQDNNLRGELQTEIDTNQALQDKLTAAMNTPKHGKQEETDAEKAAAAVVDPLATWGAGVK